MQLENFGSSSFKNNSSYSYVGVWKRQHDPNYSVSINNNKGENINNELTSFDFSAGSKRTLHTIDNDKAFHLAAGLGCEPVAFHLSSPTTKENLAVTGLFQSKTIDVLKSALPFTKKRKYVPVEATIQLHEDPVPIQTPESSKVLDIIDLRFTKLPGLFDSYSYIKPDVGLLNLLNYDFQMIPKLLQAVAELHAGSIAYSDDKIVVILTCEAYGREKSCDSHAETNMKSIPKNKELVFVEITEEADGFSYKAEIKNRRLSYEHFINHVC